MKIYEMKCKNCGADLKVSEDRQFIFCEYCGTKNLIEGGTIRSEVNHTGTVTYRDEAKLRELELKEAERIREEEKKKTTFRRWHRALLSGVMLMILVGIITVVLLGITNTENENAIEIVFTIIVGTYTYTCFVIPFFYPYAYKKGSKVLNYIICLFLSPALSGMFMLIGAMVTIGISKMFGLL